MSFQDIQLTVPPQKPPVRLDQYIPQSTDISRRRARKAIDEGGVYLNRKRCRKAGQLLRGGEKLRIVLLEGETLTPFSSEQLIWQQPPFFLIHKRSGQYAQEALHRSKGTLPDELAAYLDLPKITAKELRPVHRLDRDTSGLMLFCSDATALQHLQAHWHSHVKKAYLAIVSPAPAWDAIRITEPISKKRDKAGRYAVTPDGRACDTEAEVIERRDNAALLRLIPHTGRTHQLRVHLSHIGCPILGDSRYGGRSHSRMMLHAYMLTIEPPALPQGKSWQVEPEEDWQWPSSPS